MSRKLIKVYDKSTIELAYKDTDDLKENLKTLNKSNKDLKEIKIIFAKGEDLSRLKLLVILSPIFLATFDSSKKTLDFFRRMTEKSSLPYGLYPKFFSFDEEDYRNFYLGKQALEDIYLGENGEIVFTINPLEDELILALVYLIEKLILDSSSNKELTDYFAEMRDDIVRNGRRSILANGVQAFYLNKYIVVWMLDLYSFINEKESDASDHLAPIMDLVNILKTPAYID